MSRRRRAPLTVLAAALATVVFPWVLGSCASSAPSEPTQADTTAAQLAAAMNDALRAADSMTGRGIVRLTTTLGKRAFAFSFAATSHGDYRLETEWRRIPTGSAPTQYRRSLVVYNADGRRLVVRSWEPVAVQPSVGPPQPLPSGSAIPTERWSVQTDVPGFAVLTGGTQDLQGLGALAPEFAATARAALAAQGNTTIAGSTVGGRAVWATTVPIPWPSPPSDRMLSRVGLVVDQASGLTSSMTLYFADGWRAEITYSDLRPNVPVAPSAFDVSPPPDVAATPVDSFRFSSVQDAAAQVHVTAFLPTFVLSGFTLSQVATAQTGRRGSFGVAPDLWLVFRDGLESYQVRLQGAPFGMTPDWEEFAGLRIRDLDHGPFAGQPARTWVSGAAQGTFDFVGPGLFVENGQEVARLAGDLLPYEFWQVANSLQPHNP